MIVGMDEIDRLLRQTVSAGAAVVIVILGPGPADAPSGHPADPGHATTATVQPTAAPPDDRGPTTQRRAPDDPRTRAQPRTTPAPTPAPTAPPDTRKPGTAAAAHGWGAPMRVDDFDTGTGGWQLYDGPGHDGRGRHAPGAVSVRGGVLTITGDARGTTGGLSWGAGRRYGRWEARVRTPVVDPSYHAVLLLWPDSQRWPGDGEIDFMELDDSTRPTVGGFVHHGADDRQERGAVATDPTAWHNWAVEWSPSSITMYLDGRPWYRTTDRAAQPPGPMHLCVQLDWLPTGGATARPSTLQVDSVREYALDPGPAPDRTGG